MKKVMLGGKQVTFRTKISNSKKELARIISENGGWRDLAEFAWYGNQTKKGWFGISKPWYSPKQKSLRIRAADLAGEFPSRKVANWHQTILSRAEYSHLYPATDADGWIEWRGGECPVGKDDRIDVKFSDGDELLNTGSDWDWSHSITCKVIAYRLHKPEQSDPEFCESVTRSIPEPDEQVWANPPTIEQLTADYRNAKNYAERKQQEADAAKDDAEAKLKALELAIADIGFAITPLAAAKQDPDLVITDWRDLRVGDEVECVKVNKTGDNYADKYLGKVGVVIKTEPPMLANQAVRLRFCDGKEYWISEWRFIRRP